MHDAVPIRPMLGRDRREGGAPPAARMHSSLLARNDDSMEVMLLVICYNAV
eukprot:COSAG02_NODE_4532_length_5251_cov_3.864907_3_plen_51_part_00